MADPVSAATHLAGAVVFAVLSVRLLRRGRGGAGRTTALSVFAFACVLLLGVSGTYHLLPAGSAGREAMQRLDHAAIFVLIAASFTPPHVILFRGAMRWGMLAVIWAAAVAGVVLKTVFFAAVPEWLGIALYLGMGWIGVISAAALARRHGWRRLRLVLWGALAYTAGAVFELLRWPVLLPGLVGPHEMLHLAVLAGISCHWAFILRIAPGEAESPALTD